MPTIKLLATGGTIANTLSGRIHIDQVLDTLPEARALASFESEELMRVGSMSVDPAGWLQLGRAATQAARDPRYDAILVTHGTLTAEETAYFLHLTVQTDKPIGVVASQRPHGTPGNDGDRNLVEAVRVLLHPQAAGKGVLLLMHEEIHCAREVVKSNQRPGGFVSRGVGLLGSVESDRVSFYRAPLRRHTSRSEFNAADMTELPRVDIVASYPGADAVCVRAVMDAGARGIVVQGPAYSGSPTQEQRVVLEEAQAQGIAVVQASRGGAGRVPFWSPGYPESPFLKADNLPAQKARVLLMAALTQHSAHAELQRVFDEY